MKSATRPYCPRIALIFDFDDTLAPDSYRILLQSLGVDSGRFRGKRVKALVQEGWDEILARFFCLIELSRERDDAPITRETLHEIGRTIELFPGLPQIFDSLRQRAQAIDSEIELEFHILSAGLADIASAISIADRFTTIQGCEFHFDDAGRIVFARQIITYPEKVRYVLQISKGQSEGSVAGHPSDVYRDIPAHELHIPLAQMIYVGDGASDMPVFRLLHNADGISLALYKTEEATAWSGYSSVHPSRRVENLARADYREGSELAQSLTLAVESIAKRIALRKLSKQE